MRKPSIRSRQRLSDAARRPRATMVDLPPVAPERRPPTPMEQLVETARRRGYEVEPDDVAGLRLVRPNGVCACRGPAEAIARWLGVDFREAA